MDEAEKKRIAEELNKSIRNLEVTFSNLTEKIKATETAINKLAGRLDVLLNEH